MVLFVLFDLHLGLESLLVRGGREPGVLPLRSDQTLLICASRGLTPI